VTTSSPTGDRRTWRDRFRTPEGRLLLGVGAVFVVLFVLLLAFSIWWPLVSLPTTASNTEHAVLQTMLVFSVASAPVMALVWAIAYYSLRHWRHAGEEPPEDGPPIRGNNKITLTWVLVSSVLVTFLLAWGLVELTSTSSVASASSTPPLVVNVTGQQWVWSFSYPNDGGASSGQLVLPINRPVVFKVTSTDVIHSFWIPQMGIKVDANPGVDTTVSTTPDRLGSYDVRCAELCGLYHSYMETTVQVVSGSDFDSWVQANGGNPGQVTASEVSNG